MVKRRAIAAAVGGAAAFFALLPTISNAASAATPVDRQVYSTVGNQDPYSQGVDCTPSIHVATTAGQATATAFVHVALDALPAGAKATGVVLTLKLNCDTATQYGSPNLYACVLTEELKASAKNGDPAPKEDCNTRVSGKLAADGKSWSFELGPLVSYWNSHSNTGLSIHDQPANPAASDSVAFDSALSSAQTTFTPAASSSSGGTTYSQPYAVPNSNSGAGTSFSAPGGAGVLTVPDQAAANTPAASGSPQAKAANPPTSQTGQPTVQGFPLWALILVGSAAAAAALLVQPIAHALSNSTGPVAGFVIQLRGHPRLFATAGVLTIWSASYGTYALAHPGSGGIPGLTTPGSNGGGDSANGSTDGSNPSAAPGSSGPGAAAQGPGSTKKFGNTSVFVPDNGGVPVANLFPADQDRIGITNDTVTLCGHSALTFGPAFNVSASDLNVFWQNLNDHGGVYNRKFNVSWNDDQYKPGPAVTAAQKCMDASTFFLMGGIGFDQIPAVRVWAEQHHELYIHHMAVAQGSQGLRYSYTALPTVEQAGTMFGELYLSRYRGQKVGIIYRNSPNWDPGRAAFHQVLASAGQEGNIVAEDGVNANQGSYAKEISDMSNPTHAAQVVWSWENALGALEMIKQAKQQNYTVPWMVFPFNITLQGLTGDQGYNPPITGVAAWDAYTFGHTEGSYAAYASDINEFQREYAQYDSGANLNGPGGDLLFLAWSEFKGIAALMQACGKDCTRNKIAGLMLAGMKASVPPNCPVNFSDGHHGSNLFDIFETWNNGGNAAWRETNRCISRL
ncbi:MAG: ABC transporter substrate-binding protein [Candidatus Dormiibacterota bacterium]